MTDKCNVKVVAFDFNDTLSPSNFIQTFRKYESRLGMPADDFVKAYVDEGLLESLMKGKFSSEREFWQSVSQLTGTEIELLEEMSAEIALSKRLDEKAMQIVQRLRERYELALLTDNVIETFDFWIERFSLDSFFDVIINSAEYGILKSSSALYSLLLRDLGVEASEVLLVDDEPGNLTVAESIGVRTCLFTSAKQLEDYLVEKGMLSRLTSQT